jgi:hypothetical protein
MFDEHPEQPVEKLPLLATIVLLAIVVAACGVFAVAAADAAGFFNLIR